MYSVSISHVNDVVPADRLVAASAAMIMVNGLGAISGPILGTTAIDLFGPSGFWVSLAIVHGTLALFAAYRLVVKPRLPISEKRTYIPMPSRATLAAHRLLRERTP